MNYFVITCLNTNKRKNYWNRTDKRFEEKIRNSSKYFYKDDAMVDFVRICSKDSAYYNFDIEERRPVGRPKKAQKKAFQIISLSGTPDEIKLLKEMAYNAETTVSDFILKRMGIRRP